MSKVIFILLEILAVLILIFGISNYRSLVESKESLIPWWEIDSQHYRWSTVNDPNPESPTFVDTVTKLEWMRCSLGQVWDGSNCNGSAEIHMVSKLNIKTIE